MPQKSQCQQVLELLEHAWLQLGNCMGMGMGYNFVTCDKPIPVPAVTTVPTGPITTTTCHNALSPLPTLSFACAHVQA